MKQDQCPGKSSLLGFNLFLATALSVLVVAPAQAKLILSLSEVGGDVVGTSSGSLNLDSLFVFDTLAGTGGGVQVKESVFGGTNLGIGAAAGPVNVWLHAPGPGAFSGPPGFDSAALNQYFNADIDSGLFAGILASTGLIVDQSYVSKAAINASSTWVGTTLSDMELVEGTYTWTWGTGDDRDALVVNIGSAAVPVVATPLLVFLGLSMIGLARRRSKQCLRHNT